MTEDVSKEVREDVAQEIRRKTNSKVRGEGQHKDQQKELHEIVRDIQNHHDGSASIGMVDKVQADVEYKDFWENSEHFADLFNGVCFQGRKVIRGEELQEGNVESSGIIEYTTTRESIVRTRDVIKKTAYGTDFLILAIENQDTIDFTMPLRVMVYDGQNYLKDLKQKKGSNVYNGGEKYKISPVITVVMYYGRTPWSGPLSLVDMMGDVSSEIRNVVSDYKMHLVEVLRSDASQFQNQDVKQVIEYSQAFMKKDMEQVKEISQEQTTTQEVIYMVGKITKSQEVVKYLEEKKEVKEEDNMCEFITELVQDGERRGKIEGKIEAYREFGISDSQIVDNIIQQYQMSTQEAWEYVNR